MKFNFHDIAPVASSIIADVTVGTDVSAKTVTEFIAYVKANPGKVNTSSGNAPQCICPEMFMAMTGAKMQHVPYRGAARRLPTCSAAVQVIFDNMPSIIQHIAPAPCALAVTTTEKSAQLPDVPTVAETVPGYEASALFGMGRRRTRRKSSPSSMPRSTDPGRA